MQWVKKVNWASRDRLGRYWAKKTNRTGLIQVNQTGSVMDINRGAKVFSFIFMKPFSLFLPLSLKTLSFSLFYVLLLFEVSGELQVSRRSFQIPMRVSTVAGRPSRRRHHAGTLKDFVFFVFFETFFYPLYIS